MIAEIIFVMSKATSEPLRFITFTTLIPFLGALRFTEPYFIILSWRQGVCNTNNGIFEHAHARCTMLMPLCGGTKFFVFFAKKVGSDYFVPTLLPCSGFALPEKARRHFAYPVNSAHPP